jgi:Nuclease-related domain/UvrD-like helicase C-terminal domain/PhoH-like protein
MIPPVFLGTSPGEQLLFQRLQADAGAADWAVLHSVDIAEHVRQVEGEIDFVVIVPSLGVLCVEVKAHTRVSRDASGIWHLGSQPASLKSPFQQASEGMHSLRRFLLDRGMNLRHVPFGSAVWFTHASVSLRPVSPEWHPWQLLDRHDLARRPVSGTLVEVLGHTRTHVALAVPGFNGSLSHPTVQQCKELTARIRPICEFAITPADIRNARDEDRQAFVEEQYEALDVIEDEPRVLFTGPAGTGKTFLALEAARRASIRGETARVICFNRLLGKWLTEQLKEFPGVTVGSFHQVIKDAAQAEIPDGATDAWWHEELPELALGALLETGKPPDILIVDEIQDLCEPAYLDVLDVMVAGGLAGGRWLMFGDFERQAIYGGIDGRGLIKERSPKLYARPLYRNCRNRPRIGYAAAQAAGLGNVYRGFRRSDDNVPPKMISYETPAEQEKGLVQALDLLRSEEYSNDEIIVLSAFADGPAAESSHPGLRGRLAPYGKHASKIGYTTIHSYKGLDAPAVVVTDIDQATGERAEALLYVALSRAADRLVVLAHRGAMREMADNLLKGYGASA